MKQHWRLSMHYVCENNYTNCVFRKVWKQCPQLRAPERATVDRVFRDKVRYVSLTRKQCVRVAVIHSVRARRVWYGIVRWERVGHTHSTNQMQVRTLVRIRAVDRKRVCFYAIRARTVAPFASSINAPKAASEFISVSAADAARLSVLSVS